MGTERLPLGCDGTGRPLEGGPNIVSRPLHGDPISIHPSRRAFLLGTALSVVGWMNTRNSALADVVVNGKGDAPKKDIFISVFMRGGADGLNLVVPTFEDAYYRKRPSINVASPKNMKVDAAARAVDLDGRWALHPMMAPLQPLFKEGKLAIVHACGSGDQSRSHFEAMLAMERGLATEESGSASGWVGRHLDSTDHSGSSPLRAVAFSNVMPDLLRGATDATALNSLSDFKLALPQGMPERDLHAALKNLYNTGSDAVSIAGRETLAVLDTLNRIDPDDYAPANGAVYPKDSQFATGLKQVACMIRGNVGLEVACLDHRGPYLWDTHVAQGTVFGAQAGDLAAGLAAFVKDMGSEMGRITLVAMTEFGRRLQENSGIGTDHGRGGVMFVTGGGTHGGKVHGTWPGLEDRQLDEVGDLRVTTDYRNVLSEIVQLRLKNNHIDKVFPDFTPQPVGVVS
ncbi:MAG: DUF1501 domain-containing protein [Chthonomonadales bacterium]